MLITVDGEEIDYTLENEYSLGDIVDALSSWLDNRNFVLETLKIDNAPVRLSDTAWSNSPINSAEKLEITTSNLQDKQFERLAFLQEYLVMLQSTASNENSNDLKDIANGYEAFRILLAAFTNLASTASMPALEHAVSSMSEGRTPDNTEQLANELSYIAQLLENTSNELLQPWQHALKYASALTEITAKFEDTAVALQTGKDRIAMETIIHLTELLQSFFRCISWAVNNYDIKKLQELLEELEEALKTGDSVLIGDLLEYEIKPILLNLPQTLESINS